MHRKEKTASGRRISAAELGFPTPKNYFCRVENRFVNIHTHRPQADELTISTRGLHPWEAERTEWPASEAFADVQAVGEVGLDWARPVDRVRQTDLLRMQLRSAEQLGKPVVLHCVRAFEPLMRVLEEYRLRAVIFHGFIGSPEQAAHALKRGYYLSFGERSLRSPRTAEVLRTMPADRLFLETDESETPIAEIYRRAAGLRDTTPGELGRVVRENYKRIFEQ